MLVSKLEEVEIGVASHWCSSFSDYVIVVVSVCPCKARGSKKGVDQIVPVGEGALPEQRAAQSLVLVENHLM
ncbi:hypothetical protein GCM10011410_18390 [Hoyosella rhizosphaerae]|uniref:Uncharacterized protein n=1 Tax=Hoyosella rhizosphaerae TaxID=1755582 RepID=A0A916XDL7_9ACTN|nr:hypothetical protein GCM10011410_18390 [Hoyosella rhizosphaerae]